MAKAQMQITPPFLMVQLIQSPCLWIKTINSNHSILFDSRRWRPKSRSWVPTAHVWRWSRDARVLVEKRVVDFCPERLGNWDWRWIGWTSRGRSCFFGGDGGSGINTWWQKWRPQICWDVGGYFLAQNARYKNLGKDVEKNEADFVVLWHDSCFLRYQDLILTYICWSYVYIYI